MSGRFLGSPDRGAVDGDFGGGVLLRRIGRAGEVRAVSRALVAGFVLVAGFSLLVMLTRRPAPPERARPPASEDMAQVSQGKALFARHCMRCHGPEARGSRIGPPLVHRIYEPSHHSDAAFHLAVARGVKSHHWEFGDMAPVPGVRPAEVRLIVKYVRRLQRAAGIF